MWSALYLIRSKGQKMANLSGGSAPFKWDRVDTRKLKSSAVLAVVGFVSGAAVILFDGIDPSTPVGALLMTAITAFAPTLWKAAQRFITDNTGVTLPPDSFK